MKKLVINSQGNKWILILSAVVLIWVNLNYARWNKYDTLQHDVSGYYSYLPALFIEHDLHLNFLKDKSNSSQQSHYWPNQAPNGNSVIKYTMGMAVTYLPFFTVAQIYSYIFQQPTDGFSIPYQAAIQFSSLFYALVGLYFLMKLLQGYFLVKTTWMTSLFILFGTNLYFYCVGGAGMAHATVFGFASMFLFYCLKWCDAPNLKTSIACGVSLGILILIRPTNVIYVLVPLLYNISSPGSLKLQLHFLKNNRGLVLLISAISLLIFTPQVVYWKMVTGHYFFNSYVGEKFYFTKPHILEGLFSFRKGWLLYTPLMGIALIGYYPLYKNYRFLFYPVFVISLVFIFIAFSWWCWWYGGSFGQRAMIDLYPLLAIPLAAIIEKSFQLEKNFRVSFTSLLFFFLVLNLFQSYQAKRNVIHFDSMTRSAYFKNFFKIEEYAGGDSLLIKPDYKKALKGLEE